MKAPATAKMPDGRRRCGLAICGMWHASWTVADMDRSLAFYIDLLGLEHVHTQIQDNDYTRKLVGIEGARLKAVLLKIAGVAPGISGHVIELMEYLAPKGVKIDTTPCNVGAAHFAFATTDAWGDYHRLSAAGVRVVSYPVSFTVGINLGGCCCFLGYPDYFTL